jgi:hypothetical protein
VAKRSKDHSSRVRMAFVAERIYGILTRAKAIVFCKGEMEMKG